MKYIGNFPESDAKRYATHSMQYTHSEIVRGREVKYFDCWREDEQEKRLSLEKDGEPDKSKISQLMRFFGDNLRF